LLAETVGMEHRVTKLQLQETLAYQSTKDNSFSTPKQLLNKTNNNHKNGKVDSHTYHQ
jgi:hypothetical protein